MRHCLTNRRGVSPGTAVASSPNRMHCVLTGEVTLRTGRLRSRRDPPATVTPMTKFICVTGGVVSSLGKGIAAASLGAILEARGLKVTLVKLDPYINVDPGTMSPFQHGEVFVTDDGTETD